MPNNEWILGFFPFLLGLIVGSFCNVCIYRMPKEESVVFPASHCVKCGNPVRPYDNIPLISYIILNGKCRHCKEPISPLYPLIESLTGISFFILYLVFGISSELFIYAALFSAFIVISFIDLEHKIIPDTITLPGILIGVIASSFFLKVGFINSVSGLFLGGILFYLVAVISKGGMGGGDIKLIAMIGAFLGWEKILLTIFLSSLIGSFAGIILMVLKKKGRKDMIPYGPFIVIGAVIALFWGEDIINWYLAFTTSTPVILSSLFQ